MRRPKILAILATVAAAALISTVASTVASAGPVDWAKHHKRFLLMEGAAVTGALVHREGIKRCRLGDVEQCPEGYGETWAWYWVMTTWSTVISPAIAEACWRSTDDAKGCYFFAYNGSAYQVAAGIYDWRNFKPKDPTDTCRDLRCEDRRARRLGRGW